MANNTTTAAPSSDDSGINAVYQAIKGKFVSASKSLRSATDVTSVVVNRLIQKRVDQEFQVQVDAWRNGPDSRQAD